MLTCLQESVVLLLLAPTQPPVHHAHGVNNRQTGPKIELIIAARRKKGRGGRTTPVTIDRGKNIAIITILKLGVEDRDRGHLIAVV